jgi:hypothetical protein
MMSRALTTVKKHVVLDEPGHDVRDEYGRGSRKEIKNQTTEEKTE